MRQNVSISELVPKRQTNTTEHKLTNLGRIVAHKTQTRLLDESVA